VVSLVVAPCSYEAAKYAVEHWHYSRAMAPSGSVRYGAWEDGRFVGAVVFGRGASPTLLPSFGLDQTEGAELVRVALREHDAWVSQVVSRAVRLLRATNPGLRLLVSFADPARGHHGGIYQAMNWIYTGTSHVDRQYVDVETGRAYHPRWRRTRYPDLIESGLLVAVPVPGKHRYVLPLDRRMRRQLAPMAQPYPRGPARVA
jgi:hypothetical protein